MELHKSGEVSKASRLYEALLIGAPQNPDLLYLSGLALLELGVIDTGAKRMERLIALQPRNAAVHQALGKALISLGKIDGAIEHLSRALRLEPTRVDAAMDLAAALEQQQPDQAEKVLRDIISIVPHDPRPLVNLGNILREAGCEEEALDTWRAALELDPACTQARSNLAIQLARKNNLATAIALLSDGLLHDPASPDLYCLLGSFQLHHGRHDAAADSLNKALELRPDFDRASLLRAQAAVYLCDWDALDRAMPLIRDQIDGATKSGAPCQVSPFFSLQLPTTEAQRLAVATSASADISRSVAPVRTRFGPPARPRIKQRLHIGYLSADWNDHPNGQVIRGAFRHHNREQFEITVFADCAGDGSDTRSEIEESADRFVDINRESDLTAANTIRELGVDILVDVQGFTGASRSAIPALRPAPVQVFYQAFCGTSGSDWIDYLIVDRFVVPETSRTHFTEGLVYMPDCFMVGNNEAPINKVTTTRAEEGLPPDGPVLCSFSNPYKITREIFCCWMRMLKRLPDAALWLMSGPAPMMENLRRAAGDQGINPSRIIFAARVPDKADHLARHAHADLFLDTPVYGAHVSALDSLWAGTPVLTSIGSTFTARVGASFLMNLGMEDLVAPNMDYYEELAVALCRDPGRLQDLRTQLLERRSSHPLFDTAHWVVNIEQAYRAIWDTSCRGDRSRVILL